MANSVTQTPSKEATATQSSQDVGLIFVREYYTFLNKMPSRLHAFYNKDSLLVKGDEGTVTETARGQEEIRQKIEECNFEDCKVLVTQVDSQLSANDGILIHVLGEMCNQNGPSQKFSQTFFLATQLNGYYVLNDIFRFLKDEVEIDYYTCEDGVKKMDSASTMDEFIPKEGSAKGEENVGIKKSETSIPTIASPIPSKVSGKEMDEPVLEKITLKPEQLKQQEHKKFKQQEHEKSKHQEHEKSKQQEHEKSKQQEHEKSQQQEFENSYTPASQKTWAHLTATAINGTVTYPKEPTTVTPISVSPVLNEAERPVQQSPVQPHDSTQVQNQQQTQQKQPQIQPQTINHQPPSSPNQHHHHNKNQAPRNKDSMTQIFVKQVSESVTEEQLREAFTKIGPVKHINIAKNRNCAFVEFHSSDSVQKALNQHKIPLSSGNTVLAEERRYNNAGARFNHPSKSPNFNNSGFERRPNAHRRPGQSNTRNLSNKGRVVPASNSQN